MSEKQAVATPRLISAFSFPHFTICLVAQPQRGFTYQPWVATLRPPTPTGFHKSAQWLRRSALLRRYPGTIAQQDSPTLKVVASYRITPFKQSTHHSVALWTKILLPPFLCLATSRVTAYPGQTGFNASTSPKIDTTLTMATKVRWIRKSGGILKQA